MRQVLEIQERPAEKKRRRKKDLNSSAPGEKGGGGGTKPNAVTENNNSRKLNPAFFHPQRASSSPQKHRQGNQSPQQPSGTDVSQGQTTGDGVARWMSGQSLS